MLKSAIASSALIVLGIVTAIALIGKEHDNTIALERQVFATREAANRALVAEQAANREALRQRGAEKRH